MPEQSIQAESIGKAATGIVGLDTMTLGGLPRGCLTLIEGGPGAGKTVLALQTLVNGARHMGEPGIFVAFEESSRRIAANAASFGWDLPALQDEQLFFLDAQPSPRLIQSGGFDLSGLLAALGAKTKAMGARRIVFDALDMVLALFDRRQAAQQETYRLHEWLVAQELTAIITAKASPRGGSPMTDSPGISPVHGGLLRHSQTRGRRRRVPAQHSRRQVSRLPVQGERSAPEHRATGDRGRRRPADQGRTDQRADGAAFQRRGAARYDAGRRLLPWCRRAPDRVAGHGQDDPGRCLRACVLRPGRRHAVRQLQLARRRGGPQSHLGRHRSGALPRYRAAARRIGSRRQQQRRAASAADPRDRRQARLSLRGDRPAVRAGEIRPARHRVRGRGAP